MAAQPSTLASSPASSPSSPTHAKTKQNIHIAALVFGVVGALLLAFSSFKNTLAQSKYRVHVEDTVEKVITDKLKLRVVTRAYDTEQTWGVMGKCTSVYNVVRPEENDGDVDTTAAHTCCHSFAAADFAASKTRALWTTMFSTGLLSWGAAVAFIILLFVTLFHMSAQSRQRVKWGVLGVGVFLAAMVVVTLVVFAGWNKHMVSRGALPDPVFKGQWAYGPGMYASAAGLTFVAVATVLTGVATRRTL